MSCSLTFPAENEFAASSATPQLHYNYTTAVSACVTATPLRLTTHTHAAGSDVVHLMCTCHRNSVTPNICHALSAWIRGVKRACHRNSVTL